MVTSIPLMHSVHTSGLVFMASNSNSDIIIGMISLVWFIVSMLIILLLIVYNLHLRRLLNQKTNNRYVKGIHVDEITEGFFS